MIDDTEDLEDGYEPLAPDQVMLLWLMGANQHDWELSSEVPHWLKDEGLAQGFVFQAAPNLWRKTLKGDRLVKKRMG